MEDLLDQELADLLRIIMGPGIDIGDHRDIRFPEHDPFQRLGEPLVGRPHDFRMKCPGNRQGDGFHRAGSGGRFRGALAGFVDAGDGDIARAEQVRDLQDLALPGAFAKGFHLDPLQAEDADHPAGSRVGRFLHRGAPLLHEGQPSFKVEHAGKCHRRVLAQTQAGGGLAGQHDFGRLRTQRFQRRQAGHEQCRLAANRRIQLFGRPVKTELRQIVAENLARTIVELPRAGNGLVEPPSHADALRPLPGE